MRRQTGGHERDSFRIAHERLQRGPFCVSPPPPPRAIPFRSLTGCAPPLKGLKLPAYSEGLPNEVIPIMNHLVNFHLIEMEGSASVVDCVD